MRTTVELPPELMRAAKARAAESGESLKSLLTRAVSAEVQVHAIRTGQSRRVRLPLFGTPTASPVTLTNADLERALADADAATTRPAKPRKSGRKPR